MPSQFDPSDMGDLCGEKLAVLCQVASDWSANLQDLRKIEISLEWTVVESKIVPNVKILIEK